MFGEIRMLYVTAASRDEARAISKTLVTEQLAACTNILGEIESCYVWGGALKQDNETAFIVKTHEKKVDACIDRIRQLHSYDCPCVLTLRVEGGNPDFLAWVRDETNKAREFA